MLVERLKSQANAYFAAQPFSTGHVAKLQSKQRRRCLISWLFINLNNKEALHKLAQEVIASLGSTELLHSIWTISLLFQTESPELTSLSEFVADLNLRGLVSRADLLAHLPATLIGTSGLIERNAFDRKTSRINTKVHFEQNKYSLLRENSEGFAKVAMLLLTFSPSQPAQAVWNRLVCLVGNFDLDPDRIADLVLQAKLQRKDLPQCLELLQKFKKGTIAAVIFNRLNARKATKLASAGLEKDISQTLVYVTRVEDFITQNFRETVLQKGPNASSFQLIKTIAVLITKGVLEAGDIFPCLTPSDEALEAIHLTRQEHGKQRLIKSFKMMLQELTDEQKLKLVEEDNTNFAGQLLYSTKLMLVTQIIRMRNWGLFCQIWQGYSKQFDLIFYQPLMAQLLDIFEWSISPLMLHVGFRKWFIKGQGVIMETEEEHSEGLQKFYEVSDNLFTWLDTILGMIGINIGFGTRVFSKLCRILRVICKWAQDQLGMGTSTGSTLTQTDEIALRYTVNPKAAISYVQKTLKNILVPALSCQSNNASISIETYSLLEMFDYKFRFECYLQMYKERIGLHPYQAQLFQQVKTQQNIIANNLSGFNKKVFSKKFGKVTHNQPLQALHWITCRLLIGSYETMVPEVISSFSSCSPLTLDVAIFLMIYWLTEQQDKAVDVKTLQLQPWFKNIILFVSLFYRKYPEVDLQPILDYIVLKLSESVRDTEDNDESPGALLRLLHQLLNKMTGTMTIKDMNKSKYDIVAAGPRLQSQMLMMSEEVRIARKSKQTLQRFFWARKPQDNSALAYQLVSLIAQKRGEMMHRSIITDIKVTGSLYDEYTVVIMQIVKFLFAQASETAPYRQLVPPNALHDLVLVRKLPWELAFELYRPSIKHVVQMTRQQFAVARAQIEEVLTAYVQDPRIFNYSYCQDQNLLAPLMRYKKSLKQLIPINFFVGFWLLDLSSIYYPGALYADKIQQLRKRIEQAGTVRKLEKDRQLDRAKILFDRLTKEDENQKKRAADTLLEHNSHLFRLDCLKSSDKAAVGALIQPFAEVLVQVCLLPRLLLDSSEALFCTKFLIEVIRINKLNETTCIRLLTAVIDYVMRYLPYTTERESTSCLAIFLSEILLIFNNWSDPIKLKQDMKRILGIEDNAAKDNYLRLRDYFLKLYDNVGNLIKTIKHEPYLIKNCLYFLEKVESIPSYKQQAEQLREHMKNLMSLYQTDDMKTILGRHIGCLQFKRENLPDRPEEKKLPTKPVLPTPIAPTVVVPQTSNSIGPAGKGINDQRATAKISLPNPQNNRETSQYPAKKEQARHESSNRTLGSNNNSNSNDSQNRQASVAGSSNSYQKPYNNHANSQLTSVPPPPPIPPGLLKKATENSQSSAQIRAESQANEGNKKTDGHGKNNETKIKDQQANNSHYSRNQQSRSHNEESKQVNDQSKAISQQSKAINDQNISNSFPTQPAKGVLPVDKSRGGTASRPMELEESGSTEQVRSSSQRETKLSPPKTKQDTQTHFPTPSLNQRSREPNYSAKEEPAADKTPTGSQTNRSTTQSLHSTKELPKQVQQREKERHREDNPRQQKKSTSSLPLQAPVLEQQAPPLVSVQTPLSTQVRDKPSNPPVIIHQSTENSHKPPQKEAVSHTEPKNLEITKKEKGEQSSQINNRGQASSRTKFQQSQLPNNKSQAENYRSKGQSRNYQETKMEEERNNKSKARAQESTRRLPETIKVQDSYKNSDTNRDKEVTSTSKTGETDSRPIDLTSKGGQPSNKQSELSSRGVEHSFNNKGAVPPHKRPQQAGKRGWEEKGRDYQGQWDRKDRREVIKDPREAINSRRDAELSSKLDVVDRDRKSLDRDRNQERERKENSPERIKLKDSSDRPHKSSRDNLDLSKVDLVVKGKEKSRWKDDRDSVPDSRLDRRSHKDDRKSTRHRSSSRDRYDRH